MVKAALLKQVVSLILVVPMVARMAVVVETLAAVTGERMAASRSCLVGTC